MGLGALLNEHGIKLIVQSLTHGEQVRYLTITADQINTLMEEFPLNLGDYNMIDYNKIEEFVSKMNSMDITCPFIVYTN